MPPSDNDKRIQRIECLLEVSRSLGTSADLEALLDSIINATCDLITSQNSVILLYEAETDLLKYVAGKTADKEALRRLRAPLDRSLAGKVYTQSKSLVIQNSRSDSRTTKDLERALCTEVYSVLAVPMIFRGETIGVLEAVNKQDKTHYTEEDATILETLAAQSAVAILSTLMLDETQRAYQELEELERIKSDFIAIASHELRTPLGLILGHATDLLETIKDVQNRHQVEVIVRSANRLKKLIEDLSNVNAVQTGDARVPHRAVDMCACIKEIVAGFQEPARRKKLTLLVETPRIELEVDGDKEKLALVLSNLLENAITFTDRSGHVLVTAERLPGYVKVSVIDDGIGIPIKDLPRVFDRFYQVESHLTRRHGGMGLGLAVAKTMIEMHNGQIWCESVEGKGSNFSFLLPIRSDREKTLPSGLKTTALSKPFE